jgi:hypothetical protein
MKGFKILNEMERNPEKFSKKKMNSLCICFFFEFPASLL